MKELAGASEKDIVYSGLEEVMVEATKEHWEYANMRNMSLREACFANSI